MPFTTENARSAYKFIEKFAFPRLVGSDGELKAQQILNQELGKIGNPFHTEAIRASAFPINVLFRIILPIGACFLLLSWATFKPFFGSIYPVLSLSFSLIGLIWILSSGTILNKSFGWIPRIGTIYKTKNFLSEITPANPKYHLIFIAHYDTKSQFFPALIRVLLFIGGLVTGILFGIRILGGSITYLFGSTPAGFWNPNWITFIIMFVWNFSLIFNSVGNKSPGAIDNASSVAILLELLKLYKINPPEHTKITFLISGAEELGLYGAADYINRHKSELDPNSTFFLNYDGIGTKKALLLTAYGIPPKRTSKILNELIINIVEEQSLKGDFGKIFLPIGAATDHVPIQAAGYEVSILVSTMPRTHTSKDTIAYVKLASLEIAGKVGFELVQKLDQKFKN